MAGLSALCISNQKLSAADLPKCPGSPPIFLPLSKQPYCSKAGWHNCVGKVTLPGWNGFRYEGIWKNGRLSSGTITYNRSDKNKKSVTGQFKNDCRLIKSETYVVKFFHPNSSGVKTYRGQLGSYWRFHGKGKLTFLSGKVQDGYFKDGKYVGTTNVFEKSILQSKFEARKASERKFIQQNIQKLGLYNYSVDGLFGNGTRNALTEYNDKFLDGANLKKPENVDKLFEAVIQHKFISEVVEKLPPKVLVNNPSELEVNPKTQPNIKTTSDPVTVIPAEEGPERDLKKEFGLSLYGSFLHSEKAPKTLFFFSDIEKNDSFEFRKALRNHNIDLVVLSSPGGLVWEGLSIAGIIHDKKLNTYVPKNSLKGKGNCASACSFMFFAGEEKAVNGMLGVHQFYSGDSSKKAEIGDAQKSAQFTVSEIIGFLNEFGTPPWVYERMFQQSNMYYFKENELLQLETETTELQAVKFREIETFISNLSGAFNSTDE